MTRARQGTSILTAEQKVRRTIRVYEGEVRHCWRTLRALQSYRRGQGTIDRLFDFQGDLAAALLRVEETYREISALRRALVAAKDRADDGWRERLRATGEGLEQLKVALGIGKALGDAFAWFFLQRDPQWLLRHAGHPRALHTPTGIGGIGEREFIRRVRTLGGCLLIYHGNTTILRVGDVSLVDVRTLQGVGLGELKTKPVGQAELETTLFLRGRKELAARIRTDSQGPAATDRRTLPPVREQRFRRQMRAISALLRPSGSPSLPSLDQHLDAHYRDLEGVVRGARKRGCGVSRAGPGLLLFACKVRGSTLYRRLASERGLSTEELADFHQAAEKLVRPGSDFNSFHVASLLYDVQGVPHLDPGAQPLLWAPIADDVLEDLLLHRVCVFTVFNPAHLLSQLIADGCTVEAKTVTSVRIRLRNAPAYLMNAWYFVRLVQTSLFSEECVRGLIRRALEAPQVQGLTPGSRVALEFSHVLLRPRTEPTTATVCD